jgi:hypothetical protein
MSILNFKNETIDRVSLYLLYGAGGLLFLNAADLFVRYRSIPDIYMMSSAITIAGALLSFKYDEKTNIRLRSLFFGIFAAMQIVPYVKFIHSHSSGDEFFVKLSILTSSLVFVYLFVLLVIWINLLRRDMRRN